MIRVGLTGGIAAGKSVASQGFQDMGITVVDYDKLARDVVAPGTVGLAAVVDAFGEEVLNEDGTLNRSRVAHRVFGEDEAARERLEEIIHPLVIAEGQRLDLEAEGRGERIFVHAIPLLVEAAGPEVFDTVIVVDAPPEIRVTRLTEGRKMDLAEAWGRINAQTDDDVRLEAADVVFDGSGTPENLIHQVEDWVTEVMNHGLEFRPNAERTKFLVTEDGLA